MTEPSVIKLVMEAENGSLEAIQELIAQEYYGLEELLYLAVIKDNPEAVKHLRDSVQVTKELVSSAVESKSFEALKELVPAMPADSLETAALGAVRSGRIDLLEKLLERGLDPSSILLFAVSNQKEEVVKYLLENGADPNYHYGEALKTAAAVGSLKSIEMLIEHGADVRAGPVEDQAISLAALFGHREAVELLLKAGADLHVYKEAPLIYATDSQHFDVVEFLADRGARLEAEDFKVFRALIQKDEDKLFKKLAKKTDISNQVQDFLDASETFYAVKIAAFLISLGGSLESLDSPFKEAVEDEIKKAAFRAKRGRKL